MASQIYYSGKKATILLFMLFSFACTMRSSPIKTSQTYIVHMDKEKMSALDHALNGAKGWHEAIIDSILESTQSKEEQESPPQLVYKYETALTGFAAKLLANQLKSLQKLNGFISAYPDDFSINLHTTHSPQFLGLNPNKGLWSQNNLASDVIVGVIDTGISPEHASFKDTHLSDIPKKWKGTCEKGTLFSQENCNKKLIGAYAFWKGYEAAGGKINETTEFKSARDSEGHGTHTASTAAGSIVDGASLFGNALGSATGMRYSSRIAAYKACWASGCTTSDILAAVDKAVSDGVDILSLSLGGGSRPFYSDSIAIAAFGAIQNGVFVSCSAGNSGPTESSVTNTAPWIMTVAAAYMDRSFPTMIKLGNNQTFKGASLYSGKPTGSFPLVYSATAGGTSNAKFCVEGSLNPKLVKGNIVVCDRGLNGRAKKGEIVKNAGGTGMILANSAQQGEELFADPHILPASSLGYSASTSIKNYIATTTNPTAAITFLGTTYGDPAPIITAFSSRGPSLVGPDILKPDIAAPGMSILAAWPSSTSPSLLEGDKRRASFNIISGTSMSCPHVSGLAALIKSAHKDWSPAAVKSALMTTARTINNQNKTILDMSSSSEATAFAFGSGHVDPEKASNPGLVYDIAPDDYLNYLCKLNYSAEQILILARKNYTCVRARDLNYPSFSVVFDVRGKKFKASQMRTVTNVGPKSCKYIVNVKEPKGVTVIVSPKVLAFSKVGQKNSYKVSFVGKDGSRTYAFGELVWVCGEHSVRSPIAVSWQQVKRNDEMDKLMLLQNFNM